jgi:hypothetical protein
MLVWVSGTSEHANPTPLKSILTPSHAKVEFIELMDFKGERDAAAITKALRQRIAAVSGWPLNDELMSKGPLVADPPGRAA